MQAWAQCSESPALGRARHRRECSCACSIISTGSHSLLLQSLKPTSELTRSMLRTRGQTAQAGGVARRPGSGEDWRSLRTAAKGCVWGTVSCCSAGRESGGCLVDGGVSMHDQTLAVCIGTMSQWGWMVFIWSCDDATFWIRSYPILSNSDAPSPSWAR